MPKQNFWTTQYTYLFFFKFCSHFIYYRTLSSVPCAKTDSFIFFLRLGWRGLVGVASRPGRPGRHWPPSPSCLCPPWPWGFGWKVPSVLTSCSGALCALPLSPSTSSYFCPSSSSFSFLGFPPTLPALSPLELAFDPPFAGPRTKLRPPCYGDKVPVKDMDDVVWWAGMLAFLCRADRTSSACGVCQMEFSPPGEILWASWGDTSDRWLPGSQQMGLDKVMLMVFCLLQ